ncbi:MAG: hypothetical protein HY978_03965 [Candidatus Liptonbacteria bacterium]|nr:hypothetical protein [Candidatus Liptonbacteria bacterium]
MDNLSDQIDDLIRSRKIKPRPRWLFRVRNLSLWLFFASSTLLGAVAVAAMIFLILDHDWFVYGHFHYGLLGLILISIPYFWIAVLLLFTAAAYFNLHRTKQGYRHETAKVVGGSILLSVIFGAILFFGGLPYGLRDYSAGLVPFYDPLVFTKLDIWRGADRGLLGGTVLEQRGTQDLTLRDLDGFIWQVKLESAAENSGTKLVPGSQVRLIGRRVGQDGFAVTEVRPWDSITE